MSNEVLSGENSRERRAAGEICEALDSLKKPVHPMAAPKTTLARLLDWFPGAVNNFYWLFEKWVIYELRALKLVSVVAAVFVGMGICLLLAALFLAGCVGLCFAFLWVLAKIAWLLG